MDGKRLNGFYTELSATLGGLVEKPGNARLRLPYHLADILAIKADLPTEISEAYSHGDRTELKRILKDVVPSLVARIQALNRYHRELWHANYKPFGWEVLERRYGGLLGACENLTFRLEGYLAGNVEKLEELEEPRLKMHDINAGNTLVLCHWRVASTGYLSH
jgi:hypothetical protein